jgi:hypothetical protein
VEELNFDSNGRQRQLFGYGISAKRYVLYERAPDGKPKLVKVSEHGLGLYYRPKEGRDSDCDVAVWIKEGWEWILNRALEVPGQKPAWFSVPVMRRISITTTNVMAALRRLSRDRARPYNFAMSPVLVNLSARPIILLGCFEKDSTKWSKMSFVDIHSGTVHTLNPPTLLALPQTFEMVFSQYSRHPEHKSLARNGTLCQPDTVGLLRRYPVTATNFRLIGKEAERAWEQSEDISTLLPSLKHYGKNTNSADERFRARLQQIPLASLQSQTGLSRHTIVRARRGQCIHSKSLRLLKALVRKMPAGK